MISHIKRAATKCVFAADDNGLISEDFRYESAQLETRLSII